MDLILDTCGFLSLVGLAQRELSPSCIQAIVECEQLHISACSLFEISLKHKREQLDLAGFQDAMALWEEAIPHYRIEAIPVAAVAFYRSVQLANHHADPFDRIIIAEAKRLQCRIVSYDKIFQTYDVQTIA